MQHLPSIAHLEVLLWTREHRARWWDGESLASSLGVSAKLAERILEELCSASLLAVNVGSAVRYQFNPATPELETLVAEFVDACRQSRVRIYTLIASPTTRSLHDFADAFRFREKDRG